MNIETIKSVIQSSRNKKEVFEKLGWAQSGCKQRQLNHLIKFNEIDTSHFTLKSIRYLVKVCPICNKTFETTKCKKEKTTCSKSCAASYFRLGENHPNWKGGEYRKECLKQYGHKCAVCDESNVIEVHHVDGNRENNDIRNLIPLCPTHHVYIHKGFKHLIQEKIEQFMVAVV